MSKLLLSHKSQKDCGKIWQFYVRLIDHPVNDGKKATTSLRAKLAWRGNPGPKSLSAGLDCFVGQGLLAMTKEWMYRA